MHACATSNVGRTNDSARTTQRNDQLVAKQPRCALTSPCTQADVDYERSADHVPSARAILRTLLQVLRRPSDVEPSVDAVDGSLFSLNDLGAGIGQLGHTLKGTR